MAKSQNGWAAHETSSQMVPLSWITGRVHPDTVAIFDDLCRRFQAEVEPIIRAHSWGWNYRPIRDRVSLSNHASGTAIDLNAPAHPLGKKDTFSAPQRAAIRRILARYGGAITWGGDWTARPDDMHFEVTNGTTAATLRRITAALTAPTPTPSEEDFIVSAAQTIQTMIHNTYERGEVIHNWEKGQLESIGRQLEIAQSRDATIEQKLDALAEAMASGFAFLGKRSYDIADFVSRPQEERARILASERATKD